MWSEQRVERVAVPGGGLASGTRWIGAAPVSGPDAGGVPADAVALVRSGLGLVAGGGLLLAGLVLGIRLLSASWAPPSPLVVLATGLTAIALAKMADLAPASGGLRLIPLAARAGLIATVAAMSLTPRSGAAGDGVARGVIIAAAVALLPLPRRRAGPHGPRHGRTGIPRPARRQAGDRGRPRGVLRQRFARFEQPDGSDAVSGTVVVAVPAGARTGSGHVGFCPSFAALPTVEVTTRYDGVEATVGAAEILPWGLRVECRLADPAEELLEIPVTIVARAPPPPATLP
jgi:hypothetical protein